MSDEWEAYTQAPPTRPRPADGYSTHTEGLMMHYRNGREAKSGDKVVSLAGYGTGPVNINAIGILYDAKPGNDFCNGMIAPIVGGVPSAACLCDCLHFDDVADLIVKAGWDKRPPGK